MNFPFSVAKRFLTHNKGQSLLIILGIAIGVSVQIFIGLLISGLQDDLINTTVGSAPHITISSIEQNQTFNLSSSMLASYESNEALKYIALLADGSGFMLKDDENASILLRGGGQDAFDLYQLPSRLVEGKLPVTLNEIVVGSVLADNLNLTMNESIDIQSVSNLTQTFKVVGIVDLGVASLNERWAFTTLQSAQDFFNYEDALTSIEFQVNDVFLADEIASSLLLTSDLKISNWKESNAQLLSGLNGQSVSSIMIQVFVLVAVILGITSVLAITVLQKSRQIGILKAMGIQDSQASLIFLFQGLLLGVIGSVFGIGLGIGLILAFTTFATNPDGSALIPIQYDLRFISFSALIAIGSALLASLVPARKSSQLSPIEVIRNG